MYESFQNAKISRLVNFYKFEFGFKLDYCIACNGSGYYDDTDSPDCASCSGSGKEANPTLKARLINDLFEKEKEFYSYEYYLKLEDLLKLSKVLRSATSDPFKFQNGDLNKYNVETFIKASLYTLANKKYQSLKLKSLNKAKELNVYETNIWNADSECYIMNFL